VRGYLTEGRAWLERALANARETDPTAEALLGSSKLATAQGDLAAGIRFAEASLARAGAEPAAAAPALGTLAALAVYQGRLDEAIRLNDEALARYRTAGDDWGIADCLNRQGLVAYLRRDYADAEPLLTASADLFRRIGDRRVAAVVTGNLGLVLSCLGDLDRTIQLYEESLAISRQVHDRGQSILILSNLGDAWRRKGDPTRSAELAADALRLAGEVGDRRATAHALYVLGVARQDSGDPTTARRHLAEGLRLAHEAGDQINTTWCLEALAGLVATDQAELGARLLGAASRLREESGMPRPPWEEATYLSTMEFVRAELDDETCRTAWAKGQTSIAETVSLACRLFAPGS
jgi:tetratricopeptide (TPR) repeat protein